MAGFVEPWSFEKNKLETEKGWPPDGVCYAASHRRGPEEAAVRSLARGNLLAGFAGGL